LYQKLSDTADQSNRVVLVTRTGTSFMYRFIERVEPLGRNIRYDSRP